LIQNCVGEAREAIEELIILDPKEGLREARDILSKRYGRPHVIIRSYVDELTDGPPLKQDDSEALSKLALLMNRSRIALKKWAMRLTSTAVTPSSRLLDVYRRTSEQGGSSVPTPSSILTTHPPSTI
jgi:hypothetical protein